MTPLDIFLDRQDHLRSGWRLAVFVAVYYTVLTAAFIMLDGLLRLIAQLTHGGEAEAGLSGVWGYLLQAAVLFGTALLVGWGCGRWLDDVPLRALGWARHQGWARDFLTGSLLGVMSLMVAALVATVVGGFRYQLAPAGFGMAFVKTFFGAAGLYVLLAAAEEVLFRGYPLQTLMRAQPFVVALIPASLLFAFVHLNNPHVVPGFTFVNTTLAGVWLATGFLRTRSLWFPLGLHWAWNWAMGSLLGLPVSGITSLTHAPLLRAADHGPAWLTGGSYGIEGGAACTVALIVSTLFIWRTGRLKANEELRPYTDGEGRRRTTSAVDEMPATISDHV